MIGLARLQNKKSRRRRIFRLPLGTVLFYLFLLAGDGKGEAALTLLCAVLHELGHVAAARLAGYHNIAQAERLDEHRVFCPQWGVTLRSAAEIPENCTAVAVKQLRAAVSGEENTVATQAVGRTRDGSLFVLQSSGGGLWYATVQGEVCLHAEEILPLL